jgi:parallel beta-helix repeat protein
MKNYFLPLLAILMLAAFAYAANETQAIELNSTQAIELNSTQAIELNSTEPIVNTSDSTLNSTEPSPSNTTENQSSLNQTSLNETETALNQTEDSPSLNQSNETLSNQPEDQIEETPEEKKSESRLLATPRYFGATATVSDCATLDSPNTYYTLTDDIVNHSGSCFSINADNITLDCKGFRINGNETFNITYSGISSSANDNITIANCTISEFYYDVSVTTGENTNILNNSLINSSKGIYLQNSNHTTITSNTIFNTSGSGFRIYSSSNLTITSNNLSYLGYDGIYLFNSNHTTITSNTIFNASQDGIDLRDSSNLTITSNNLSYLGSDGIYISSSNHTTITSNTVFNASRDGIDIYSSSNLTITSNNLSYLGSDGIYLQNSNHTTISSNTVFNASGSGVDIYSSSNLTITSNNLSYLGSDGIYISSSNHTTITSNTVFNASGSGFDISSSSNITISSNTGTFSGTGLTIYNTDAPIVSHNRLTENEAFSYYEDSDRTCGCSIFTNNTGGSGKPIKYITGQSSQSFGGFDNNYSEIVFCNVNNSRIGNITLSNPSTMRDTILILKSDNNRFSDLNIDRTFIALISLYADNNHFSNMSIGNCSMYGLVHIYSHNSILSNVSVSHLSAGMVFAESNHSRIVDSYSNLLIIDSSHTFVANTTCPSLTGPLPTDSGVIVTNDSSVASLNNTFLNVTYSSELVTGAAELTRQWYITVNVTNESNGAPIDGATVTLKNNSDAITNSGTTDSSGIIRFPVTEYKNISGTTYRWTNYTARARYNPVNSTTFNFTSNTRVNITLNRFSLSECANITRPGYYYLTADIINHSTSCFNITADDVTFNGQGHLIDGNLTMGTMAINVSRALNVTIANTTFSEYFISTALVSSNDSTVENLTSSDVFISFGSIFSENNNICSLSSQNSTASLLLANSHDMNIYDIHINSTYLGIEIAGDSFDNRISDVNIENSLIGIITAEDLGLDIPLLGAPYGNEFVNISGNNNTFSLYLLNTTNNRIRNVNFSNDVIASLALENASYTTISQARAVGSPYPIAVLGPHNLIADSSFSSNTSQDVYLINQSFAAITNNTFLNCTYGRENVTEGGELIRQWYITVNVTRAADGAPISGATGTLKNNTDAQTDSGNTNSIGRVRFAVTQYKNISGTTLYQTNYTANATHTASASESFNFTDNKVLNITLEESSPGPHHSCSKEWECTAWEPCVDGLQTRECKCDCLSNKDCYGDNEETRSCGECTLDSDCDDGDSCTEDSCDLGACEHTNICECETNADCDDTDPCTSHECVNNYCEYEDICGCEDDSDCPDGYCLAGDCVDCLSNSDCDDSDPCTIDSCVGNDCEYTNICECQDDSDCSEGICLEGECIEPGCEEDADCDDGNPCTINICTDYDCSTFDADGFACSTQDCRTAFCEAGLCIEDSYYCGEQSCDQVWNCSAWSECVDDEQTRDCECVCDYCGADPVQSRPCGEEKEQLVIYTSGEDFLENDPVTIKILDENADPVEAYLQITDPDGKSFTILTTTYVLTPDITGDWKLTAVRSDYLPAKRLLDVLIGFQEEESEADFVFFDESKCCIFNVYGPRILICWYWWILFVLVVAFVVGYKYRKSKIQEEVEIV